MGGRKRRRSSHIYNLLLCIMVHSTFLCFEGHFICRVDVEEKKGHEIQPGFKPGSSGFRSDALTN